MQGLYVCAKNEPLYPATILGRSLLGWIIDPPACFFCLLATHSLIWMAACTILEPILMLKTTSFVCIFFNGKGPHGSNSGYVINFLDTCNWNFGHDKPWIYTMLVQRLLLSTPTWSRLCRYQGRSMSVLAKKNDFRQPSSSSKIFGLQQQLGEMEDQMIKQKKTNLKTELQGWIIDCEELANKQLPDHTVQW